MAGGIGPGDGDAPLSDINVTPLVDVMLVLLVIFIVTAPLLAQALRVDLPRAEAPASGEPKLLTVVLQPGPRLMLDDDPVGRGDLPGRVAGRLRDDPGLIVRVAADGTIPYQHVADLISLLREAGAEKLAFATQAP